MSVYRSQREELLSQFGEKRKLINWLQTERSNVVVSQVPIWLDVNSSILALEGYTETDV